MDWKKLITELESSGLSQKEISDTVGCSQPYVSQLKTGKKDSPDFAIGTALVALHEARANLPCSTKNSTQPVSVAG